MNYVIYSLSSVFDHLSSNTLYRSYFSNSDFYVAFSCHDFNLEHFSAFIFHNTDISKSQFGFVCFLMFWFRLCSFFFFFGQEYCISNIMILSVLPQDAPDVSCLLLVVVILTALCRWCLPDFYTSKFFSFPFVISKGNKYFDTGE